MNGKVLLRKDIQQLCICVDCQGVYKILCPMGFILYFPRPLLELFVILQCQEVKNSLSSPALKRFNYFVWWRKKYAMHIFGTYFAGVLVVLLLRVQSVCPHSIEILFNSCFQSEMISTYKY